MVDLWGSFVKMIIALPLVLFLVVIVLRANLHGFQGKGKQTGNMRVVDRLPVSRHASLLVIEIQGVFYLLGCLENQMVLLDKLEEYFMEPGSEGKNFEQMLAERMTLASKNMMDKFKARKGQAKEDE